MRILITGAGGLLGQELASVLDTAHDVLPARRADCDVTSEVSVQKLLSDWRPSLIVNCAASADVDACERDSARAFAVNASAAGILARAAERIAARLYHISTDYVFDGSKRTPYAEQDPTNPVNVYGRSKLEGERAVLERNGRPSPHLVIRTSWLFGAHRPGIVEKVIEEAQSSTTVRAVEDQVSCPTWTLHLAQTIAELIQTPAAGLLHVANSGACSRYEMARAIVQRLGSSSTVEPIRWPQLNRPARRPAFSALDCSRLRHVGLALLPTWQDALNAYCRSRNAAEVGR